MGTLFRFLSLDLDVCGIAATLDEASTPRWHRHDRLCHEVSKAGVMGFSLLDADS